MLSTGGNNRLKQTELVIDRGHQGLKLYGKHVVTTAVSLIRNHEKLGMNDGNGSRKCETTCSAGCKYSANPYY